MKRYIALLAAIIAIMAVWAWYAKHPVRTQISAATYMCNEGKTISAVYYDEPSADEPEPNEPPVPTGSVELSIDSAASTTLRQTLSGSGVRYANADESFVFWNKGREALIMRDNAMDLAYRNCLSQ